MAELDGMAAAASGDNGSISGAIGGTGGIVGSIINIDRAGRNYNYYIQMLDAQKEKQSLLPDNVSLGGSNATLLGYGLMDNNIFTTYTIKYQFAKKIDDFFSMFRLCY